MPKVWLIVFFGYNGQNFNGMQLQKGHNVRPIENDLVTIFYKAGLLPTQVHSELVKSHKWGRAARTDKGVHAVQNAVSCLFSIPEKFYDGSKQLKRN